MKEAKQFKKMANTASKHAAHTSDPDRARSYVNLAEAFHAQAKVLQKNKVLQKKKLKKKK